MTPEFSSSSVLIESDLRRRIMGCWLGKAVGGTLGQPYEGVRHTLDLTFYDPVPTEMIPNDDLDLQVIAAFLLDAMPVPRVDRQVLKQVWQHVGMSPDEYGIAKRNLALGLSPPTTGSYDNPFSRGMGAAIRTELWACLAAGDPASAVRYCYEDACMDHVGEGVHAASFLAAIEAAAFVLSDRNRLLDLGLSYIPADSELSSAITDTRQWWSESRDWKPVHQKLTERYLNDNFTDVVINLAYTVLGWLAGDNFGQAICIAVNCGQDTDCTGATLGSILGILDPDAIDDRWLTPIGSDLVLSDCITGVDHPSTLDGFTELVLSLRDRLDTSTPAIVDKSEPTDHLAIHADIAWVDAMPTKNDTPTLPSRASSIAFPGNWVVLDEQAIQGDVAIVSYRAHFDADIEIQLVFASPQPVRVWLNGKLVIDSPGGEFVPAIHRTRPQACLIELTIEPGDHELIAAINTVGRTRPVEWLISFADANPCRVERDYLIDPLRRKINTATVTRLGSLGRST